MLVLPSSVMSGRQTSAPSLVLTCTDRAFRGGCARMRIVPEAQAWAGRGGGATARATVSVAHHRDAQEVGSILNGELEGLDCLLRYLA